MAVLSKIRNRSGFLIVVIGLALFAFVASPKDIIDFFSKNNQNAIGEINGKEVPAREFAQRVEAFKAQSQGRANSGLQAENSVWNQVLRERLYQDKLEEAGVVIGEQDIWEAIITNPQIKGAPRFQKDGAFNEDALKAYIAGLEDSKNAGELEGWLDFENRVKQSLLIQTYNQLIGAGISSTKAEGDLENIIKNASVSAEYVYVPYTSIKNDEVEVSESEVKAYINAHAKEYQVKESRDVKFVKFDFKPSQEDEDAVLKEVTALIEDKEEYNNVTKSTELVAGLRNTEDAIAFVKENDSDLPINENYQFESTLPSQIKEAVIRGEEGTIVGPYKLGNYYELSKLVSIAQLPDSVQASHILINYAGARSATAEVKRTEAEAKQLADSILNVVKKSKSKLAKLAPEFSSDKGSAAKGGDLGWFNYTAMVPEFRDFCFEGKKGEYGVVKSIFGFHIIKIEGQKNKQNAYKLISIAKKIEASDATESSIFEKAETFAQAIRNGGDYDALVKEGNLVSYPYTGVKELDTYVGSLGQNRRVVRWAFENETTVGTVKRFDLDEKGYAVVVLTNAQDEGVSTSKSDYAKVKAILQQEKKADLIAEKMNQASLTDIAKANDVVVKTLSNVKLSAPTIAGIGSEPAVIGAIYSRNTQELVTGVAGKKGVFAFVQAAKNTPKTNVTATEVKNQSRTAKNKVTGRLFNALKEEAEINDYRAERY